MNDDNLLQFELPQPVSTPATDATDAQYLQTTLASRLNHVTGLLRDLALLLAREDVTTDELALIDQITTQLEQVLYHKPED